MKINSVSADEILSEANRLYSRWADMPVEAKRKIVEGILEKAVIGPGDEIELTLAYLPTSEEMVHSQQRLSVAVAIVASRGVRCPFANGLLLPLVRLIRGAGGPLRRL